jgi:hypothetical protein
MVHTHCYNSWQEGKNFSACNEATVGAFTVPDRRSRNNPEVVLVRRWAVRVLGIWRGEGLGEGWDKGISLQAA